MLIGRTFSVIRFAASGLLLSAINLSFFVQLAIQVAIQFPAEVSANVEQLKDYSIHQHYRSARALGMGGAFTAVADDYSSLFYNPAGLARLKEAEINLGLSGELDVKFFDLLKDIETASKNGSVAAMLELLESNYGNHYSARVPTVNAIWARPNWAFAFIPFDLNLELEVRQLAAATLSVIATQDSTLAYGRGWDVKWFPDHHISMGITGKAIYRGYFNRAFLATDLVLDSDLLRPEDATEGLTVDFDWGMLWTPKVGDESWLRLAKPTVGFNVRNVLDYGFKTNLHLLHAQSTQPSRLGRRLDVGTVVELPDWWIWKTRGMFDIRDIGHENWSVRKGLHVGVEFLWKVASWWQGGWRAGVNQGYFTAGFTGEVGLFKLDLVTTAEEVGTSDTPKANRRYMAKLSLDW